VQRPERPYPVTDAQVHIWADERSDRPWPPEGRARAHRFPAFAAADLMREMDDADVDRAVLVPPSFEGDRNDVVTAAARRHPDRLTVMARFDPLASDAQSRLEPLLAMPEIRGFRMTYHRRHMFEHLTADPGEWFWAALAADAVPVMIYAPGQNAALRDLAARHPGLPVVVDTLGLTLTTRDDDIDAALRDLMILADTPNIAVKATALPAHVTDDYPFPSLGPRLRRVVDAFGMRRVFWASDLTRVDHPYRDIVDFPAALEVLDAEELTWLMGRGITEWLDWPLRGSMEA
jgi:predicted TIM-barrel fold metal-dependent hydrolase